jgi:hypothetical protein
MSSLFPTGGQPYADQGEIGTRYVFVAVRILVDPADPHDVQKFHGLQDALMVSQSGAGSFDVPSWDPDSQKRVRDALLSLSSTLPDLTRAAGRKDEVDQIRHLIASASAWGLNPDKDAIYLNVIPSSTDGSGVFRLKVTDVPVDGFWSISVYDAEGHFVKNAHEAYTLNNLTARSDPTDPSRSSSVTATTRSPTACPSSRVGTTWCVCTGPGPKSWTAIGPSLQQSRPADVKPWLNHPSPRGAFVHTGR